MRLYPPAYLLARRSEVDQEIGGYAIPAGITVGVSQYATHRHPAFWHDPDRFDPDRFAPAREVERHPYAYFPFGRGPRACIGLHFAMLEAVIAVAVLLQRYRVTSKDAHAPIDTKGITLRPKGPILIGLIPRSRQAGGRAQAAARGCLRSNRTAGTSERPAADDGHPVRVPQPARATRDNER
jgi:cytochrome P450